MSESVRKERYIELDKKVLDFAETLHKEIRKFELENKCGILLMLHDVKEKYHYFRLMGCIP